MTKTRKRFLALFMAFTMLFSYFIPISSVKAGEIIKPEGAEWLIDEGENHVWYKLDGTTLTIGGSGDMPDWSSTGYTATPWFGKNITSIIIEKGVTKIGDYSFVSSESLESVKLAESVKNIGNGAFRACSNLNTIEFKKGLNYIGLGAFNKCGFTSLTFPEGLTEIDWYAFQDNLGLTKVVLPSSLTSIGQYGFSGCINLKTVISYKTPAPALVNVNALNGVNIENLTIPYGALESYKTKWGIDDTQITVNYLPRKVNVSSTGIKIRVVLSTDPQDDSQCIPDCEFFVNELNPCNQDVKNDRLNGDVYVYIEPDFTTGGRISTIKINGESKDVSVPTGRNVYKLPSTNTYTIEVHGVEEKHYNIMWANDGANVSGTDYDSDEILLKNGSAKIVKVYDNVNDMNDITDEIDHSEEGCINPEGKGYVSLTEGNVVIFEFLPKYGYQLTSVSANGTKLEAQETTNQYKYIMPGTNIHFQATFTKTEDIVKTTTNKVKNGSIKLGQNEIDAGSSVLTVKDAVLSDEQKNAILEQAGEYKVSNILDIKLDQVFYKGSSNENDVWSNPLGYENDLKSPAVITLKLEDGVDGDEIVLVHEKEDGTYEIIETEYDKENNTITFETKSFSNYAIATKTTSDIDNDKPTDTNDNQETINDNPKTGDSIYAYISLMVIALAGIIIATKSLKKRK